MPQLLCFSRNRCSSVEQLDQETIRSQCRLQDTLMEASVEIIVKMPDLEIKAINSKVSRTYQRECLEPANYLQKLVGIRVGPGMLKIIRGLLEEVDFCGQLAFMIEECCHGIILCLTKDVLSACPDDKEGIDNFFTDMVKENIRLYNRCAAFAIGSPLVEGIEPPG